jgi:hypothetical protein
MIGLGSMCLHPAKIIRPALTTKAQNIFIAFS